MPRALPAILRIEVRLHSHADRLYSRGGEKLHGATVDHECRLQRLQEILGELVALTDWKSCE
jgi:hypothetical protein